MFECLLLQVNMTRASLDAGNSWDQRLVDGLPVYVQDIAAAKFQ